MNIKMEEAAKKAEELMTAKYRNDWLIIYSDESGEENKIKPEYLSEYDEYYKTFFFN